MLRIYILPTNNPFLNLATEEYFLTELEKSSEDIYLLFYENRDSIILGKTLNLSEEVYNRKKKPVILRRSSGGGSVVHFKGNLNYSLLLSFEKYPHLFPIQDSYKYILNIIAKSVYPGLNIEVAGISDLSVYRRGALRKISGNAQTRKRKWLMHHGTILYSLEHISKISYFLKPPPKEPEYRQSRKHKDFLLNSLPRLGKNKIIRNISSAVSREFQQTSILCKLSPRDNRILNAFCQDFIKNRWLYFKKENLEANL